MKKKLWIIITGSVVAIALLIGVVLWFVLQPADIHLTVTNTDHINYNNYTNLSDVATNLDYRNGKFTCSQEYYVASKLTMWDHTGQSRVLWGCGSNYQLQNDMVVYKKYGDLYIRDFEGEAIKIVKNVESYIVHESGIVYSRYVNGSMLLDIYWYDLDTQKETQIQSKVGGYCIADDKLVIYDPYGWVSVYTQDECVRDVQIESLAPPETIQLRGNELIYAKSDNELELVDLYTGNTRSVVIYEACRTAKTSFICDDQSIFVSFQAIKYDGSIVTDVSTEGNGVWYINPETLEKKKICDRYFSRLYLFNGDVLLGIDEYNNVYQISIEDGTVSELMD